MPDVEEIFEQELTLPFSGINGALHDLTGEEAEVLTLLQTRCLKEIRDEKNPSEILETFLSGYPKYYNETAKKRLLTTLLDLMEKQLHLIKALTRKMEEEEPSLSPLAVLEAEVSYQEIEQRARETLMKSELHLSFDLQSNIPDVEELLEASSELLNANNKEEFHKDLKTLLSSQKREAASLELSLQRTEDKVLPTLQAVQGHLSKTWLSKHNLVFDLVPQITAGLFCNLETKIPLTKIMEQVKEKTLSYYQKEISKFKLGRWTNASELFQELVKLREETKESASLHSLGKIDSLLVLCRTWRDHAMKLDLELSFSQIEEWMEPHMEKVTDGVEELLKRDAPKGVLSSTDPALQQLMDLSKMESPIRFFCIEGANSVEKWLKCCYFFRLVGFGRPFPFQLTFKISSIDSVEKWVEELYFLLTDKWYLEQIKEQRSSQWLYYDWDALIQTHGLFPALWKVYQLECRLAPVVKRLGIQLGCISGKGNSFETAQTLPYQWLRAFGRGREHSHLAVQIPLSEIDEHFRSRTSGKKWVEHFFAATWKQTLFPDDLSEPPVEDFNLISEMAHDIETSYKNAGKNRHFHGLGSAIDKLKKRGNASEMKRMYEHSRFFRLLLRECSLRIDSYLPSFEPGEHDEYLLSRDHIRLINEGKHFLIDDEFRKRMNQFITNLLLPARVIEHYLQEKLGKEELDESWNSIFLKARKLNQ